MQIYNTKIYYAKHSSKKMKIIHLKSVKRLFGCCLISLNASAMWLFNVKRRLAAGRNVRHLAGKVLYILHFQFLVLH